MPMHVAQTEKSLAAKTRRKRFADVPAITNIGYAKRRSFTADEVVDALTRCRGFVTYAAKMLGMSYRKLKSYIDANEKIKRALEDINEMNKDYVESKLFNLIDREQEKSVHFYLRGRAKSR